ncbi:MAG: DUF4143 domain-containing protein [Spirochaetales bacterium]|nr:DUF4143 domain-containing protein [Spirochaetales bacterium]
MFGFETQKALLKKTLTGHAKGGIYENLIFDMLHKRGYVLNYYKRSDNTQEIEFVFERDVENKSFLFILNCTFCESVSHSYPQ